MKEGGVVRGILKKKPENAVAQIQKLWSKEP
jgi:hypothetical protein